MYAPSRAQNNPDEVVFTTSTEQLFKILKNVTSNPNEPKFRKLRKGNPCIVNLQRVGGLELLRNVGFVEAGDFLVSKATNDACL